VGRTTAIWIIAALSAWPGHADEASINHAADSLVKAFIGYCVQVIPNLDRIETSAKALGWRELDQNVFAMAAPPSQTAKWKGWRLDKAADVSFVLGVSQDTVSGKSASACAVINPYMPPAPVRDALMKMLSLGQPAQTVIEAGQQYTYWTTTVKGEEIVISLIDATPMEETGVNLSASTIR
jgi:hypothetical protein